LIREEREIERERERRKKYVMKSEEHDIKVKPMLPTFHQVPGR
jgi:hypothetical protein